MNNTNLSEVFTGIATSLRTMLNTNETITPSTFASKILEIPVESSNEPGNNSSDTPAEQYELLTLSKGGELPYKFAIKKDRTNESNNSTYIYSKATESRGGLNLSISKDNAYGTCSATVDYSESSGDEPGIGRSDHYELNYSNCIYDSNSSMLFGELGVMTMTTDDNYIIFELTGKGTGSFYIDAYNYSGAEPCIYKVNY